MGLFGKKKDISKCVFDWDAYYDDIKRGISVEEESRKFQTFAYYVDIRESAYQKIPIADYAK